MVGVLVADVLVAEPDTDPDTDRVVELAEPLVELVAETAVLFRAYISSLPPAMTGENGLRDTGIGELTTTELHVIAFAKLVASSETSLVHGSGIDNVTAVAFICKFHSEVCISIASLLAELNCKATCRCSRNKPTECPTSGCFTVAAQIAVRASHLDMLRAILARVVTSNVFGGVVENGNITSSTTFIIAVRRANRAAVNVLGILLSKWWRGISAPAPTQVSVFSSDGCREDLLCAIFCSSKSISACIARGLTASISVISGSSARITCIREKTRTLVLLPASKVIVHWQTRGIGRSNLL